MNSIIDFFFNLLSAEGFMPRWICGRWSEFHGWFYIISDLLIASSYFIISYVIYSFIQKRRNTHFTLIFWLFIAFIFSCGLTHLMDTLMFWIPLYRFAATIKFLTAFFSVTTVFALFAALPKALSLRSNRELEEIVEERTAKLQDANRKLFESERKLKALIENNPNIISELDKDLNIHFINDSITRATGKPVAYYIGNSMSKLGYKEEQIELLQNNIDKVFTQKDTIVYESEDAHKSRFYETTLVPLVFEGEDEEVGSVMAISHDITLEKNTSSQLKNNLEELETLSSELIQKNKYLEDFANITSHNLRSPLISLNSLLEMYQESGDEEEKNKLIGMTREASLQLTTIIEDLSEAVKVRREINLEKVEVNLEKKLGNTIATLSGLLIEKNARITFDFTEVPVIHYPKIYIESLLLNLLSNALKYSSPNRQPEIRFKSYLNPQQRIILTCEDNGIGIDMVKYGDKLFKLHKTFHTNSDARGLGLFITKNQIEALGGSIWAESELDVGTKFSVMI